MISVLIIWAYMAFTCFMTGFGCIRLITGKNSFRIKRETGYLMAGLIFVTVYSQVFSLFYKVGLAANLILTVFSIAILIKYSKELGEHLRTFRLTITPVRAGVTVLLILLFAYGTSRGILHYDTGLYHAQSIRWIEEYGLVPGLGNLHSRLAYNSSSFCLTALYSMAFTGIQSYHVCVGFMAINVLTVCLEAITKKRAKRPVLSDFVRLMAVYYLLMIFDEMISPASDYFMVLTVFFIVIKWLDLLERDEKSFFPYALLCVAAVFTVTVKLSGAMLLLLTLKPAIILIKEKKWNETGKFLSLGIITAVPYLIRNVILSGWLLYPFTAIDLFSFDFKIPKGMAEYDAREIKVWGRGVQDVNRYGDSMSKWVPDWFNDLAGSEKIFFILAAAGILVFLIWLFYSLFKRKKEMWDYLLVAGTLNGCFLFWFLNAPLIRYGCVFLWLAPVLTWGYLYIKFSPRFDRYRLVSLLVLAALYKAVVFGKEIAGSTSFNYLLLQKDYENYETISYDLHGYRFYVPKEGDRTGYRDFPSSPVKAEDIFRGGLIEDGFKDVIHQKQ